MAGDVSFMVKLWGWGQKRGKHDNCTMQRVKISKVLRLYLCILIDIYLWMYDDVNEVSAASSQLLSPAHSSPHSTTQSLLPWCLLPLPSILLIYHLQNLRLVTIRQHIMWRIHILKTFFIICPPLVIDVFVLFLDLDWIDRHTIDKLLSIGCTVLGEIHIDETS